MTSDRTNIRRKTGDERRSLILNEIDATRGWVLAESAKHLAAVWPMSKPCEFEFVPRKLTVRDSVAQIGNYTSKSEVLIQSRTALNVGELENLATDQIGSITAKRTLRYARNFWVPEQVQDEMLVSRGKEARQFLQQYVEQSQSLLLYHNIEKNARFVFHRPWIPHY